MPLNTLRLNHQPSSHPNERIVFIKPLPRPSKERDDYDRADLILKAIAAQCLPIMKGHHLSVTTLEEYEPNPEFVGRNFNNGEVIQLVIKSKSGAWLPLNMIQMVMMHELAHNSHMNHGKGFWQTRNLYASEMRDLWSKGYTGEGLWGRGRSLRNISQAIGENVVPDEELARLPLCGGTFRSRGKKRKAKGSDLTWKEKRDRRIEKKFGVNGEKLGEDEDSRLLLEINRKGPVGGKPRVAQSKRGRELRAAAALARFDTNKKEVKELEAVEVDTDDNGNDTDTESEYEKVDEGQEDARDRFGQKMLDAKGRTLIRICEEEGTDDVNTKMEIQELAHLGSVPSVSEGDESINEIDLFREPSQHRSSYHVKANLTTDEDASSQPLAEAESKQQPSLELTTSSSLPPETSRQVQSNFPTQSGFTAGRLEIQCPICSMMNSSMDLSCTVCAHVLDVKKDPRHWKCANGTCKDNAYINAGDCGICGVCGAKNPNPPSGNAGRPPRSLQASKHSAHIAYI